MPDYRFALISLIFILSACGNASNQEEISQQHDSGNASSPAIDTGGMQAKSEPANSDDGHADKIQDSGKQAPTKITADPLVIARKSGCLACHTIDKKLVGPAWNDVAARYTGNAQARQILIQKVSQGGKGNWQEVTGGAPMPPYSPRVSNENIALLVDFVLSLQSSANR